MSEITQVPQIHPGLEGIYAVETKLSKVDGERGRLTIAGFPLEEIAPNASFEEMVYLLLHDRLPNSEEFHQLSTIMKGYREIPDIIYANLKEAAKAQVHPMDALRIGVSSLTISIGRIDEYTDEQNLDLSLRIISALPTMLAAFWRYKSGLEKITPNQSLNHSANFLYMLTGEIPSPEVSRALETYQNTVSDHGLNASTFVARAIVSTDSDLVSAITGAIGSLKGPKHGGAPGPALDMVFEIGKLENAEPYIRNLIESGHRIMGFGHRVYKVRDPRADVLAQAADKLYQGENREFYDLVQGVEKVAIRLLEEYKPGRNLQTNVEFYTALVLHGCGLESDIFSSIFAMSRVVGWCANVLEQFGNNRIIRPKAYYIGDFDRVWIPIENR